MTQIEHQLAADAIDQNLQDTRDAQEAVPDKVHEEAKAVKSILPYLAGDRFAELKASYLSYRYVGFSLREACQLAGIHQGTLNRWRRKTSDQFDRKFAELEEGCSGPERHAIRREVLNLLFTRNFTLVLRRDYEVFMKVLGMVTDSNGVIVRPTATELAYATKARVSYSAQQLEAMERLLEDKSGTDISLDVAFVIGRGYDHSSEG